MASTPSGDTAPPPTTTDPADEAGGEVVYSSDGLLPLEVTKPPVPDKPKTPKSKSSSGSSNDGGGADGGEMTGEENEDDANILESGGMDASEAFEVFRGKIFSTKNTTYASQQPTATLVASVSNKETPLQRLARLQAEVAQVEAELRTTTANSGRTFDEELVKLACQLKTRLNDVSSTARLPEQDELTRLIHQQLEQINSSTSAGTGGEGTDDDNKSTGGVIYELYGTSATSNPTTTIEERLTKVERLVGNSVNSHKSLLSRLEELETLANGVDEKALEHAATKAKVIRADLEAASKARTKLNSTATFTKKEDSKTIQQLHQQMTELEGLSQHLPALTQRLQQLATLHVQSATFATRLSETEKQASLVQASLGQLESTLDTVQKEMVTNCQIVEKNVKQLDERLHLLDM